MDRPVNTLEVCTTVNASVRKAWNYWTIPGHIKNWNAASAEWHTPKAEINLVKGGKFSYRMEAINGSAGFEFSGIFDNVILHKRIEYTLEDGRKVIVLFEDGDNYTIIKEIFEPESENTIELQQMGWQAILDNYKQYTEGN